MSIVANFDVNVRGDTKDLSKALSEAEKSLQGFVTSAEQNEINSDFRKQQMKQKAIDAERKAQKDFQKRMREDVQQNDILAEMQTVNNINAFKSALTQTFDGLSSGTATGIAKAYTGAVTMIATLVGGPVAGAVASAVGVLHEKAGEAVDSIIARVSGGMSRLAGLQTNASLLGTTPQTLAALQFVGQQTGASIEGVNSAMAEFSSVMNQAGMASGPALLSLAQLGFRGRELSDLTLQEKFLRVADAISKVGNAGDRVRLAQSFGLTELLPAMMQGRAALEGMVNESRRMGSGENARNAREAQLAWIRFKGSVDNAFLSLASGLAPALSQIAELIDGIGFNGPAYFRDIGAVLGETVRVAVEFGSAIAAFVGYIFDAEEETTSFGDIWDGVIEFMLKGLYSVEYALTNFETLAETVFLSAYLFAETWGNNLIHLFTEVIPQIFTAYTEAFKALVEGDSFFDTLEDGLQGILHRAFTPEELELQVRIMEGGQDFDDFIEGRLRQFRERVRGGRPEPGKGGAMPDDAPDGPAMSGIPRKTGAFEFGSKEAFSTIYGTLDRQAQALAVANQQLMENRAARQALERLVQVMTGQQLRRGNL